MTKTEKVTDKSHHTQKKKIMEQTEILKYPTKPMTHKHFFLTFIIAAMLCHEMNDAISICISNSLKVTFKLELLYASWTLWFYKTALTTKLLPVLMNVS